MPAQRLSFVAEDDAVACGGVDSAPGLIRTASWDALMCWDAPGMRRSSTHDMLEALLAIPAAGLPGGAVLEAYPDFPGLGGGSGGYAAGLGGARPHGSLTGFAAAAGQGSAALREAAEHDDAPALLTAAHASRLAGLISAAPLAAPVLLPMLAATDWASIGQQTAQKVSRRL